MKFWIALCAALAIVALPYCVAEAQTDTRRPSSDGDHAGYGALRTVCQADLDRFCSDVAAGGGRVMQCLRQNQDALSDGCKSALQSRRDHRRQHDGAPDGPTPTPTSPQG